MLCKKTPIWNLYTKWNTKIIEINNQYNFNRTIRRFVFLIYFFNKKNMHLPNIWRNIRRKMKLLQWKWNYTLLQRLVSIYKTVSFLNCWTLGHTDIITLYIFWDNLGLVVLKYLFTCKVVWPTEQYISNVLNY
jgi:hypothetical protein